jgi:hypothetical protein
MNRWLSWGLGATGALSAWMLLNPAPSTSAGGAAVVAAAPAHVSVDGANAPLPLSVSAPTGHEVSTMATITALPAHWPAPNVDPATRNPFVIAPPPAPKPVAAKAVAPVLGAPPPVSDYRFWGRVAVQGGQPLTYVARGDAGAPVAIDAGTHLEDGWSVESIGDNAIVLVHAATQQRSTLSIPPHAPASQR